MKFDFRKKAPIQQTVPARSSNRLCRLMALAIRFEDMLRSGEVVDYSELANRYGVERGRISRIMHLRLLASDLQEQLLNPSNAHENLSLKHMMPVCKIASWKIQRERFKKLRSAQNHRRNH